MLSIPRDTFVPDARAGGLSNKVDAALANGPSQLVQAIKQDFGIPINHYVVLNFESFADIVNALGGVDMYFPTQIKDMSGITQMKTGCQHISGIEALALVRARHLYYNYSYKTKTWRGYDGSGDLGRIERDHIFLKVLAAAVRSRGLGNPATDEALLAAVAPQLTVDTTFGDGEMLNLVHTFHSVSIGGVPEYTAPIVEDTQAYIYKGYPYGDVVFPTEPQDQQTIDAFMGVTPAGLELAPSAITVSVVDGTGSAAPPPPSSPSCAPSATAWSPPARRRRSVQSRRRPSSTPPPRTCSRRRRCSRTWRAPFRWRGGGSLGGADVTIVTGSDLAVVSNHPTQASPAAHASHRAKTGPTSSTTAATTTTTTPSTDGGVLAPPTAATSSIPPTTRGPARRRRPSRGTSPATAGPGRLRCQMACPARQTTSPRLGDRDRSEPVRGTPCRSRDSRSRRFRPISRRCFRSFGRPASTVAGMGAEACDVVVVGSGFGGSTAALRLTEKGYRVVVLEAGRRFDETTLPKTSWRLRSFFWAPKLGLLGIQRISLLKNVMVLSGAGVGGGSLVYANTLYDRRRPSSTSPVGSHHRLARRAGAHYDQARRMLGVVRTRR